VRTLRNKSGARRADPERHSFAFFAVGTLVVIAVAFFLGLQLGRYVEKDAVKAEIGKIDSQGSSGKTRARNRTSADIRNDISAFSAEAVKIPAVAPPAAVPPTAGDDLKKTESEATFPEALSRKDSAPEPMGRKKEDASPARSGDEKIHLQAGAMRSRDTAEGLRKRLEKGGFTAKVVQAKTRSKGEVYRVRVGPFRSREEAMKAKKSILDGMKIDAILLKG
jgi:cell division protein FtsN